MVFISILGLIPLALAVFVGFANKFGFDMAILYDLFFGDLTYVITYIGWRITTMVNATGVWLINSESIPFLQTTIDESLYRFSSVFGMGIEKPEIRSLARFNYLEIFVDNSHKRSGTSPGLFGSFASTLPSNLPAFFVLTFLTIILLKALCRYQATSGWLPTLVMVAATYQFFDSPIDLLITPHPGQVALFIFVFVIYYPRITWTRGSRFDAPLTNNS